MTRSWIRILFFFTAAYDFLLGAAFLFSAPGLFQQFNVPAPQHFGYVQFCSLMLMIFGAMFLKIALNPKGNRDLIPFGIMLKVAYVGLTGFYWVNEGLPFVFKPFVAIDTAMLVLFVWAYFALLTGSDVKPRTA